MLSSLSQTKHATSDVSCEPTDQRPADESTSEPTDHPDRLPKDVLFDILSVSRRREVLKYLDENEGEATLGPLAEHVAAIENDVTVAELSADQRKRVYVALYQVHLPKMDDAGIIDYDKSRGTIELGRPARQVFPYLYLDPTTARDADSDSDEQTAEANWQSKVRAKLEEVRPNLL